MNILSSLFWLGLIPNLFVMAQVPPGMGYGSSKNSNNPYSGIPSGSMSPSAGLSGGSNPYNKNFSSSSPSSPSHSPSNFSAHPTSSSNASNQLSKGESSKRYNPPPMSTPPPSFGGSPTPFNSPFGGAPPPNAPFSPFSPPPQSPGYGSQPFTPPLSPYGSPPFTPPPPLFSPPPQSSSRSKSSNSLELELKMMNKIKEAERQMRIAEAERRRAETERSQALYHQQVADRQRQRAETEKRKAESQVQRAIREIQQRADSQMGHLSKKIQQLMGDLTKLQTEKRVRDRLEREQRHHQAEIRRQRALERKLEFKLAQMVKSIHRERRKLPKRAKEPSATKVLEAMLKAALTLIRPSLQPYLREAEEHIPLRTPQVDRRLPYFMDSAIAPSSISEDSTFNVLRPRSRFNKSSVAPVQEPIDY